MFAPVLSRSALHRVSAALVLMTVLSGPAAAVTPRQPVAAPACPLSTESLPDGVKHTLCHSDTLLGEALLVRAEERLRLRFAQPREAAALQEATARWDQRLSQCGPNETCLSSLLQERRKGLEAELQDRAGRWPTAAGWRLQGAACSQAGAPLPVTEAVAVFS